MQSYDFRGWKGHEIKNITMIYDTVQSNFGHQKCTNLPLKVFLVVVVIFFFKSFEKDEVFAQDTKKLKS